MKRWALVTVLLYLVVLSLLSAPVLFFLGEGDQGDLFQAFFLFLVPALVIVQAILLLVPVSVARGRPVKRRSALISAIIGALPLGLLLTCFVWFILIMILGEDGALSDAFGWVALCLLGILWVFWGALFYRRFSPADPAALTTAITGWLLRGSILEILVAIPSHIIARHRNECCTPAFTLMGLVTGLSVAVMAFGPGLFFLFAGRIREKRKAGG